MYTILTLDGLPHEALFRVYVSQVGVPPSRTRACTDLLRGLDSNRWRLVAFITFGSEEFRLGERPDSSAQNFQGFKDDESDS